MKLDAANARPPVVVITGPTASGKSSLAMNLAITYGGEIICADSRTVYKGLDIGTAKPTEQDQTLVRHWVLDVVNPNERFTAADFARHAETAIEDIYLRGKIPFVVGGTGLYIDGLVKGYNFGPTVDEAQRSYLNGLTVDTLKTIIKKQQIALPVNSDNKRHLVRAIEQKRINTSRKLSTKYNYEVVIISTEKLHLEQKIRSRAEQIFNGNVVEEATKNGNRYGWDSEAMKGNIYPIIKKMLDGELNLEQAKELFIIRDRQLAKRQVTWFKRHDDATHLSLEEAEIYLSNLLERHRFAS